MKFQVNKIATACALALGLASGAAIAHGPGVTPDVTIYIGGASAQDNVFTALMGKFMTSVDYYYDNKTVEGTGSVVGYVKADDGSNFRAAFGTWRTDEANLSGLKVLVVKRSAGGSYFGIGPVQANVAINFMKVNSALCTLGDTATVANSYVCNIGKSGTAIPFTLANSTLQVPDVGLTDVEPALFTDGENQPPVADFVGDNIPAITDVDQVTATGLFAVGFGIQGGTGIPVTNLTSQQYASIAAGNIKKWNQLNSSYPATDIVVCRRTKGSGTQAFSNAYFLNAGGCGNAASPAKQVGAYATSRVKENVATGDVRTCLESNPSSVGWISLEDNPTGKPRSWLSLNGVAVPNVNSPANASDCTAGTDCNTDNMLNGSYDAYAEQTFVAPNTVADKTGYRTADQLNDFISAINAVGVDPTVLKSRQKAGILALASQTGTNTISYSRGGNTCAPSVYSK